MMNTRHFFPLLLAVSLIAVSALACNTPGASPTSGAATATPLVPGATTEPGATEAPTEAPGATVEPTLAPPPPAWLPAGTIALAIAGDWESPNLYALSLSGAPADMGLEIGPQAVASHSGRWIAYLSGIPENVIVTSMADGTTYVIPVTAGFTANTGATFDRAESRLAFLEMGGLGSDATVPWAIVVVNLADGSTTRFDAAMDASNNNMPGSPFAWTPGDELLISTFMPYTEGNYAGVWGINLPPGTPSAPLTSLTRREIVPMGEYRSTPRLSFDGNTLLYLSRDYSYTPAGYEPMAYDMAVNQLWTLNLAGGAPALIIGATDGSALGGDATWSPEGKYLFAQGNYAGEFFTALTLRAPDNSGVPRDIGPVSLPPSSYLVELAWCEPSAIFYTTMDSGGNWNLNRLDVVSSASTLLSSNPFASVIGCVY